MFYALLSNGQIYIYIYIYTNLPPNSIYGDKEKEKKCQNSEITIYLEWLPREKRKSYREKKQRKGQPCHTNWKKSRDT